MNLIVSTILIILSQIFTVIQGTQYAFLVEDTGIFSDCKNEPDYLTVNDVFDLSNLNVEPLEDSVHIEGSFTVTWDADPNDRVELKSELFKYERGSWQPTIFTLLQKDFCSTLFQEDDAWYKTWTQYVIPEDRKCINQNGHVYHHVPFDLETIFDIKGEDISGKHKVVIKVNAYNQHGKKQPYPVCVEILGDIIKK